MRFFNTAGPVNCTAHYCLPPLERFDLADILGLIEPQKYFVLYAPRQTGKTSALLALREYLNAEGRCRALYINFEVAQGYREQVNAGWSALLREISLGTDDGEIIPRELTLIAQQYCVKLDSTGLALSKPCISEKCQARICRI